MRRFFFPRVGRLSMSTLDRPRIRRKISSEGSRWRSPRSFLPGAFIGLDFFGKAPVHRGLFYFYFRIFRGFPCRDLVQALRFITSGPWPLAGSFPFGKIQSRFTLVKGFRTRFGYCPTWKFTTTRRLPGSSGARILSIVPWWGKGIGSRRLRLRHFPLPWYSPWVALPF